MPSPRSRLKAARSRGRGKRVAAWLVISLGMFACKPAGKPAAKIPELPATKLIPALPVQNDSGLHSQLAAARINAAMGEIESHRPERAVALLIAALKTDPTSGNARGKLEKLFEKTSWSFPAVRMNHRGVVIEQLAFMPPSTLWVSVEGKVNTTVRWNLATMRIESVLFPLPACKTRALIPDPAGKSIVVQRGPTTLLCNATTLKPVCDIGTLPDFLTPASVIVFSPDGLLVANPTFITDSDHSIIWNIRDAASGQIIRTSPPIAGSEPPALAACLDRARLRVLDGSGSLLEIPVSPVEPVAIAAASGLAPLLHAQFSRDGNAALILRSQGPHQAPLQSIMGDGSADTLTVADLEKRFSWSAQPNIWNGLFREAGNPPFAVDSNSLEFPDSHQASVATEAMITSVAVDQDRIFTGDMSGMLTIHRLLALPVKSKAAEPDAALDADRLKALENLTIALAGWHFLEEEGMSAPMDRDTRIEAAKACDLKTLQVIFPSLNFEPLLAVLTGPQPSAPAADAFSLLTARMERAEISPADEKITTTFSSGDDTAILTAIREAGAKGASAASALQLALQSDHVSWIQASLATAADLPLLLQRLAVARIARLETRNADALSLWPDDFPDLTGIRLREDWDGWEQADFMPAFTEMRAWAGAELAAIDVGPDITAEQRKAVAARLLDPATVAWVGKPRFAAACLKAALAFSAHKEETETTLQLTGIARNLGAAAEPCLRAEALAYTALGDYKNAHPRWIELITEHPVETHIPGDYAEAAYTAFENSDPAQAMQILTTGMHRFPHDGNFALRAGWVALLTGNSARAYQFLTTGRQIGFPPEKYENAVALLTIAAFQVGASDDAAVYFQELLKIDAAWADAKTLDTLDWPEELKSVLRQFMR